MRCMTSCWTSSIDTRAKALGGTRAKADGDMRPKAHNGSPDRRPPPKAVILSVTEGGARDLLYLSFNTGAQRRSTKIPQRDSVTVN